ncbi:amidohydrolase family protein [Myxococcota bacterium]|nr:amidohydrolase family protein [Myxococcota bacterium]
MSRFEIADAHQHVGGLGDALGAWGKDAPGPDEERRTRLAAMDTIGASWSVIQPSHSYLKADGIRDTRRVNDAMAVYRQAAPDRFRVALGTVEPSHGEHSLEEIDRVSQELSLDGLSWHHRLQGGFIDSPWMRPYLKRMSELNLVPAIHTNAESKLEAPWRLQKLALEFPELTFLAYDAFYSYEQTTEVIFLAEQTPNIVWDLGGPYTPGLFQIIEPAIRNLGAERFCFSADMSYVASMKKSPPPLLDSIVSSTLSDDDKQTLLAGSVRRLFGTLEPPAPDS